MVIPESGTPSGDYLQMAYDGRNKQEPNMGHKYLGGKNWKEITREERYFCLRLFNLIESPGERAFIEFLNKRFSLGLDPGDDWEVAFEACFYRDRDYANGDSAPPELRKRTFDLALFGPSTIIAIEAKAQEGFVTEQLLDFENDRKQMKKIPGVGRFLILGLVSSRYQPRPETRKYFDAVLTWQGLAGHFGEKVHLPQADGLYPRNNS